MAAMLLCLIFFLVHPFADALSGPYHLRIINITDCGEKGQNLIHFDAHFEKLNETTSKVNSKVNLPVEFGDQYQMHMAIKQWKNDSLKDVYSLTLKKMCSGLKELLKDPFAKLTNYLKIENKCPIPAGSYNIRDFDITMKPSLYTAPYGTYWADLNLTDHEKQSIGCAKVVFVIFPRESES